MYQRFLSRVTFFCDHKMKKALYTNDCYILGVKYFSEFFGAKKFLKNVALRKTLFFPYKSMT